MSELGDIQQDVGFAWRSMEIEWTTTKENWRDSVAVKFEREYWNDLEAELPALLSAMSEMEDAIQQAVTVLED